MLQTNRYTMKLLIYLVVFVLLFNGCTANNVADSLIQKYCKQSSEYPSAINNPNYYNFCIASLKENPESQKARNIDELIVIGAINAMSNLTNVKRIVEKIIKERKYKSRLSKKLLGDCVKLYSEARDFSKASNNINEAKNGPTLCELEFNGENQQVSPVRKENDVLFTMIDIPYLFNSIAHN
ncbi:hypothetical protein EUTSA_v10001116mg [Eutrema salsugineum]|uniref:Pectinesterase inhibitor domain-containing protein n=1 Tax=Eutrema salsugineum TaxID=72664 RepID=V4KPL3_EUTSA|nr:hypothetical protein EUTSA_v10001116mg [Eutrema salsugineum]